MRSPLKLALTATLCLSLGAASDALAHAESVQAEVSLQPALSGWNVRAQFTGLTSGLRVTGAVVDLRAYPVTAAWARRLGGGALSTTQGGELAGTPLASVPLSSLNGGEYSAQLGLPGGRYVLALVDTTYPGERAVAATALDLRPSQVARASLVLPKTQAAPTSRVFFWLALAVPVLIAVLVALISLRSARRA